MQQFTLVQLTTAFSYQIDLKFILIDPNPDFPEILAHVNKNHQCHKFTM